MTRDGSAGSWKDTSRRRRAPATPGSRGFTTSSARNLIGREVIDAQGQFLGWLHDLILDTETGSIAFAVVGCGLRGIHKRFAVPWATLHQAPASGQLMWRVHRDALEHSPGLPADYAADDARQPLLTDR